MPEYRPFPRLIASAPTLEAIVRLVNDYFFSTSYTAFATVPGYWSIASAIKGTRPNLQIVKRNHRFQFRSREA